MTNVNGRTADYPIDPIFLERWSPRAYTGEPIAETELMTMLEAARWAASSSNRQPWRFIYARRGTPHFEKLLGLLVPQNQVWAKDASALVFFISNSLMRRPGSDVEIPSPTHSFDTGLAAENFNLQAHKMGWFTHGMIGLDRERAHVELKIPATYTVEAAYAVGRRADPSKLPEPLREREKPSDRLPLTELAFEGGFLGEKAAPASN
jgi:nitroreductase